MRLLRLTVFLCTLVGTTALYSAKFTQPEKSSATSEDGTVELEWTQETEGAATFRIERATSPVFKKPMLVYEGPDTATFVSGLPEGLHYFRLREGTEPWGNSVLVIEVTFVSETLVVILLTGGVLCLLLLIAALVQGHKRERFGRQMRQVNFSRSKPVNLLL